MFDTIIRGGTIFEDRGGAPYHGVVGIKDGWIGALGALTVPARLSLGSFRVANDLPI